MSRAFLSWRSASRRIEPTKEGVASAMMVGTVGHATRSSGHSTLARFLMNYIELQRISSGHVEEARQTYHVQAL